MVLLRERLEELGIGYVPVLVKRVYNEKKQEWKKTIASYDDISPDFIRFHQYFRRPRYNYIPRRNQILPEGTSTYDYAWTLNRGALAQYIKHKTHNDNLLKQHREEWSQENDGEYPYILVMAMDCRKIHIVDVDDPLVREHPEINQLLTTTWFYYSKWRQLEKLMFGIENVDLSSFKANPTILPKCEMQMICWSYFDYDTELFNTTVPLKIYSSLDIFLDKFPEAKNALKSISSPSSRKQKQVKDEFPLDMNEIIDTTIFEPTSIFLKNAFDTIYNLDPTYFNEYNSWFLGICICKNHFIENKKEGFKMAHYFSKLTEFYDEEEVNEKWINIHKSDYDGLEATSATLDNIIQELSSKTSKPRLLLRNPQSPRTTIGSHSSSNLSSSLQLPDVEEMERMLAHFPQHVWESPSFKEDFVKSMKCIDDRDTNYERCKLLISHYTDHTLDDKEAYQYRKLWDKFKTTKKYGLKFIQSRLQVENPDEYERIYKVEKENYPQIKIEFEKTHFKLENPVRYICILPLPDTPIQYLTENCLETKYRHLKCFKYSDLEQKVVRCNFTTPWINDPKIRRVLGIAFNPRTTEPFFQKNGNTYFNTFSGLRAEKLIEQNVLEDTTFLQEVFDFICNRLCNGNKDFHEYFLNWLAHIVQKPWEKTKVMPIFMSQVEGTGKSMFFNWFGKTLLGEKYYYSTAKTSHIVGRFNSMMENRLLVIFNEVRRSDTKDEVSTLKDIIDSPTLTIENKGIDAREIENYCNFATTTNNDIPFAFGENDRRYTGIESKVGKLEGQDAIHFGEEVFNFNTPNDPLVVAFYNHLKQRNLQTFCTSGSRVMTDFVRESIEVMVPHIIHFLFWYRYMSIEFDYEDFKEYDLTNVDKIQSLTFYTIYDKWFKKYGNRKTEPLSLTSFGRQMKKLDGVSWKTGKKVYYTLDTDKLNLLFKKYRLLEEEEEEETPSIEISLLLTTPTNDTYPLENQKHPLDD